MFILLGMAGASFPHAPEKSSQRGRMPICATHKCCASSALSHGSHSTSRYKLQHSAQKLDDRKPCLACILNNSALSGGIAQSVWHSAGLADSRGLAEAERSACEMQRCCIARILSCSPIPVSLAGSMQGQARAWAHHQGALA